MSYYITKNGKKISSFYFNVLPKSRSGKFDPLQIFPMRSRDWFCFSSQDEAKQTIIQWTIKIKEQEERWGNELTQKMLNYVLKFKIETN